MASSSLDGSSFSAPYSNGQRGSYPGPGLDRPGSFRESLMVSGGPMASRSAAATSEIPAVSQYLSLEQFATSELKSVRSGELRRVLGVSVEEHSFGSSTSQSKPLPPISWEELKRFKVSVQEMSSRARDRAKLLQESLLKLDKYRNLVSRKRQKNEFQSSEKAGGLNLLKIGGQMHQNPSDLLSQRLEERTKNAIPNKRVRSSIAEASLSYLPQSEGRNAAPVRQGAIMDKDKTVLSDKDKSIPRANNCSPLPCEEKVRVLPAGGDGWDNRKMKRGKRSGPPVGARTADGDRDFKQAMQQRSNNDPRPRSSDALGFRTSSSNVVNGSSRMDSNSQLSSGSSRVVPRNDLDTGPLTHERRERTGGVDKERLISKGSNKLNIRDDAQLGSQSSLTKGKSSRAQRTGSAVMVSTPNFPRSSGSSDGWEQPSSVNKVHPPTGAANRKRPLPTGSSSPPVQWASQRPLKISRSRRAIVVSPVSNLDESQAPSEGFAAADVGPRLTSMDSSGVILSRGMTNNTTQIKVKLDNVPSPPGLSESEESGAPESKCKEKEIDNIEIENGTSNATPKASTFVFPTKKNKLPPKEEIGDGVRRQGRSGRGSVQSKAFLSVTKEKLENVETTKLAKNGKLVSEKTESRIGRPPSKKVSDRKGCTRPGQTINSGSSELAVEPEDDLEELLAAANAARTASSLASSSPFWKKMESMFSCVTSEDLAYLKHQINFAEELDGNLCDMFGTDQSEMGEVTCHSVPYSDICLQESQTNAVGTLRTFDESHLVKTQAGKIEQGIWSGKAIPLSQRLLSAIITEDESEDFDSSMKQGDAILQFSSVCSPCGTDSQIQNELSSAFDADHDLKSQTNCFGDNILSNGCATTNCFRSPNNFMSCDEISMENDAQIHPDTGPASYFGQSNRNRREALTTGSSGASYECHFEHMSLDDRILMELHSIGIYPDIVPDLAAQEDVGEIEKVISELKIKLYQQVREKKSHLSKLEKAMQEGKEYERRDLEQHAMNKLVEMANKRLLGGRGSSSHKGGASKVSKQLALAFAKRTLARCHKFERTGQSCFSEPVLRDCLFSEPLRSSDAIEADGFKSGIAADMCVESRNCPLASRVSASGMSSIVFERHGAGKIDRGPLDSFQGPTEQTFAKTDSVSNRGKKREVLLDEVVSNSVSRTTSTVNNTLPGGAKWKKTEKDNEKDALSRNSTQKAGRLSLSTGRGERKTKAKPKQKIAQLSNSGNGLGRVTETTTFVLPSRAESCETMSGGSTKVKQEVELPSSRNSTQELSKETKDNIFTNLPLQGIDSIDELDVADGLGGQGQDIASWLNVDEEALEDADLDCLQIPMDDLADLNMNF